MIRRALRAGHRPRSYLMAQRWLDRPGRPRRGRRARRACRSTSASATVIEAADRLPPAPRGPGVDAPARAALASQALLAGARRVAVLEDIVDHTNVGAIFRSCAALGVDAVLVTPRCADPLYRRSVRVSMGTVFQVPWTRIDPWPGGLEVLRDNGFTRRGLRAGRRRRQPGRACRRPAGAAGRSCSAPRVTACRGAPSRRADLVVRIPMAGGVDSLNVAAASAVALWALRPPQR